MSDSSSHFSETVRMGTVHANSPVDALSRLETLTLFSGVELPLKAIMSQVSSAIHLIVQTSQYHDGSRKISYTSEVMPLSAEGDYMVKDLFAYNQKEVLTGGRINGSPDQTGVTPSFLEEIKLSGFMLSDEIFNRNSNNDSKTNIHHDDI